MKHPKHDQPTRCIEIPEATADALAKRLEGTEFETIDDYATFALEQLLDQLDRHDATDDTKRRGDASTEETERDGAVEERLESLGYL